MTKKYTIEVSDVSNQYVAGRAIDAENLDDAIGQAKAFLESKGGHIARVFTRRNSMAACVTADGEVCKSSWFRG